MRFASRQYYFHQWGANPLSVSKSLTGQRRHGAPLPQDCPVMNEKDERKPYNPYHLATGHAAKSLPDKVTVAVFQRLGAHTDFLGTTTVGIKTRMDETHYSHGRVCDAIETLKKLKRITKVSRYHPGRGRGRSTSVTRLHCTA